MTTTRTIPAHFAWVYHGKGDDVRLAFVRPSVMRGMVLARMERRPGERFGSIGTGAGPIRMLHKREADIARAATLRDAEEVERLVSLLVKYTEMSIDVLREAVPT